MAFIEIKDPKQREHIVNDYFKIKQELRTSAENDKARGLEQQVALEKQYNPIIKATQESAKVITRELQNNHVEKGSWQSDEGFAIDYYLKKRSGTDRYYGIQKRDGGYKMGTQSVEVEGNDIIVDGKKYIGTPGLWQLIMLNKPVIYTKEDFAEYENLVEATQVIFKPLTHGSRDKPERTVKYTDILSQLEKQYGEDEDTSGDGILPGNIEGLLHRFKLVFAERRAGNIKSTTSEIVSILDELLRQNYITRAEYNETSKYVGC